MATPEELTRELDALSSWSSWHGWSEAVTIPTEPGVYVAWFPNLQRVYVGKAQKRGLRERLNDYRAGNDLNGLAEAAIDAAFADEDWLQARLDLLRQKGASSAPRARDWLRDALMHADVQVCWSVAASAEEASELETRVISGLVGREGGDVLLNRYRPASVRPVTEP